MNRPADHVENDRDASRDAQLDQILRHLGNTQPAPGLDRRVLAALEAHRASASSQIPFAGLRAWRRRPSLAAASLLIAVLALGLVLLPRKPGHPPSTLETSHLAPEHQPIPLQPGAPSSPAAFSPVKVGVLPPSRTQSPLFLLSITNSPAQHAMDVDSPASRALDQQALADLHTPSFPSPSLPPTAQERMVRLMLRRGEKHDLAQLDTARIAAYAQQERADFSNFFDPPPPPESLARQAQEHTAPPESPDPPVVAPVTAPASQSASASSDATQPATQTAQPGDPQ